MFGAFLSERRRPVFLFCPVLLFYQAALKKRRFRRETSLFLGARALFVALLGRRLFIVERVRSRFASDARFRKGLDFRFNRRFR